MATMVKYNKMRKLSGRCVRMHVQLTMTSLIASSLMSH